MKSNSLFIGDIVKAISLTEIDRSMGIHEGDIGIITMIPENNNSGVYIKLIDKSSVVTPVYMWFTQLEVVEHNMGEITPENISLFLGSLDI